MAEPAMRSPWLSRLWFRLALAAVIGLAGGLAVLLAGTLAQGWLRPELCLGIGLAAAVLVQLVRETAADAEPREPAPQQSTADRSEYLARLRQLERRLEAASRDGSKYDRNVRPLLARLVADRLRQKYGIDPGRQPERAREVLPDQLWSLLVPPPEPGSPPPTQAQLSALVDSIEVL
jgi:hypothetical protein